MRVYWHEDNTVLLSIQQSLNDFIFYSTYTKIYIHRKLLAMFLTNTSIMPRDLMTRFACPQCPARIGTVIPERASATTPVAARLGLLERTARTVSLPEH